MRLLIVLLALGLEPARLITQRVLADERELARLAAELEARKILDQLGPEPPKRYPKLRRIK